MSRTISNAPLLHLPPSHWWNNVLALVVDDNFVATYFVFWSDHQYLTAPIRPFLFAFVIISRIAQLAFDTELTATDLQCAYPRTTGSSSALESSRTSESWMWLGAKDVTMNLCGSNSTLEEFALHLICSLIWQFIWSKKLIQCSKWYPKIRTCASKLMTREDPQSHFTHKFWEYLQICSWLYKTSDMRCLPHRICLN